MFATLAALYFALAAFDAYLSRRRILTYGLKVELNQVIVTLCAYCGVELGVLLGIMVPSAAMLALMSWTHFEVGLAVLTGFRFNLFITQLRSLAFEKELIRLKAELISRGLNSSEQGDTLPPESKDSKTPSTPEDKNDR